MVLIRKRKKKPAGKKNPEGKKTNKKPYRPINPHMRKLLRQAEEAEVQPKRKGRPR